MMDTRIRMGGIEGVAVGSGSSAKGSGAGQRVVSQPIDYEIASTSNVFSVIMRTTRTSEPVWISGPLVVA